MSNVISVDCVCKCVNCCLSCLHACVACKRGIERLSKENLTTADKVAGASEIAFGAAAAFSGAANVASMPTSTQLLAAGASALTNVGRTISTGVADGSSPSQIALSTAGATAAGAGAVLMGAASGSASLRDVGAAANVLAVVPEVIARREQLRKCFFDRCVHAVCNAIIREADILEKDVSKEVKEIKNLIKNIGSIFFKKQVLFDVSASRNSNEVFERLSAELKEEIRTKAASEEQKLRNAQGGLQNSEGRNSAVVHIPAMRQASLPTPSPTPVAMQGEVKEIAEKEAKEKKATDSPPQEETQRILRPKEKEERYKNALRRLRDGWREMEEIPRDLRLRFPKLFKDRCSFSNRPIRKIMMLRTSTKLRFDEASMKSWVKHSPDNCPPGWPLEKCPLPIREEYFIPDEFSQTKIDVKLEEAAKQAGQDLDTLSGLYNPAFI